MKNQTLIEIAYEKIKQGILEGDFQPGDKLNIENLKRRYGIGLTPLREALNRLVSSDWVEFIGLKGFRVTPISKQALEDIYAARQLIETKALALAIENGDDAWESEVLASFHRLSRLETDKTFIAKPDISEWMRRYQDFHFTLLNACGSAWLLKLDHILFEQSERYRYLRLTRGKEVVKIFERKARAHKKLIHFILSREMDKAIQQFSQQLNATVKDLLVLWASQR